MSGPANAVMSWGPVARLRQRWSRWDTVLLVGSLLLLAGAGIPLPGYTAGPGPTRVVDDLVTIADAEVFPPEGELLVATVALHPLSPFRGLQAWLDGDIKRVPAEAVASDDQRAVDMRVSRSVAVDVALRRLGFAGPEEGTPSDDPPTVAIDASGVDGNSAGLAFTLGILDLLTPGELTGGTRIGVTGTIQPDGGVGPVGSIPLKTVAVREAGAELLLVPGGQGREAEEHAGDGLEVVEVSTLDQALTVLEGLGGDLGPLDPAGD